jgi:nicotinamide-nucleotide amidase
MNNKAHAFIKQLQEKNLILALAESVTCGLAAHKLATAPGTSDVLAGSIVCYTPEVKRDLLGVSQKLIDRYTCESMEVTEALAKNLEKLIDADIHAALTGLASPGGSETKEKPVGTIFFCIKFKNKMHRYKKLFRGTPLEIRKKACMSLYEHVLKTIHK